MQNNSGQALSDIDLAASIAAALHVQLQAPGITVDVSHAAVTLEGEAETEAQRHAAESIARRFCKNVTNSVDVKRRV